MESDVLKSLKPDDGAAVTGLDTWFDLIATDVIWLECTVASYAITESNVNSYGQGDAEFDPTAAAWTTGGYVTDDGGSPPEQDAARVMLAYAYPGDAGEPVLVQTAFDHFLVKNICVDDFAAIFLMPSPYRKYDP